MIDFGKFVKNVAPVLAIAFASGLAGCNGSEISINGEKGKPLAELDLAGKTPTTVTLMGPDSINIVEGDNLQIAVSGKASDKVRFVLDDDTLAVLRDDNVWSDSDLAVVTVTMPAPSGLVLAGSGNISSQSLAKSADVTIAGSGKIEAPHVDVDKLDLSLVGSGSFEASGVAKSLDITIAGSGDAALAGLKVDKADVSIAGSGNAEFASDGTVEASIMGSGNVTVTGNASCKMNGVGSGTLNCRATAAN